MIVAVLLAGLPVPSREAGEIRDAARRVLARPEYQPPRRSVLGQAFDWVVEQFGGLFDALVGGGAASIVAWVVVAAAVVLVLVLATRVARGVTPSGVRSARGRVEVRRSAAAWREQARADEAAGRWRSAVRSHWRALVADLAERGVVDEISGRTAGEYRVAVAADAPAAAPPFAAATDVFEVAWYGHRPTGPADAEQVRALAADAIAALERPAVSAPGRGAPPR